MPLNGLVISSGGRTRTYDTRIMILLSLGAPSRRRVAAGYEHRLILRHQHAERVGVRV